MNNTMKLTERLGIKLLQSTHWFCLNCGDFHRHDVFGCICSKRIIEGDKQ